MAVHDWTRVDAGIFHAFHHDWITEISRALNRGLLPADYYALPEQIAGEFGPDVLTLNATGRRGVTPVEGDIGGGIALAVEPPQVLTPDVYIAVPLEATYHSAWEDLAGYWRNVLSASA